MGKTLQEFVAIIDFLGDEMTEEQAARLMDEARSELSIADIKKLSNFSGGSNFHYELSQYDGEMGGLSRWLD